MVGLSVVQATTAPSVYGVTTTLLITGSPDADTNWAVMSVWPVTVTVSGLVDPVASPLQPENTQPELGTAVSVACSPYANWLLFGLTVTEPPPTVDTFRSN